MSVRNSEGCRGGCDAKCYNATTPECKCICGGVNHGVGLEKAVDKTRYIAESVIVAKAKWRGIKGNIRVFKKPVQMELFKEPK